jgi:hypothetical protein
MSHRDRPHATRPFSGLTDLVCLPPHFSGNFPRHQPCIVCRPVIFLDSAAHVCQTSDAETPRAPEPSP